MKIGYTQSIVRFSDHFHPKKRQMFASCQTQEVNIFRPQNGRKPLQDPKTECKMFAKLEPGLVTP